MKRFEILVPAKEESFSVWAEDVHDARNKAIDELGKRFGRWGRAYLVSGDGRVLSIIPHYVPGDKEIAAMSLVDKLGDLGVPFFEWLFGLIELMKDAPHWEASYSYPDAAVEVVMDEASNRLRVTVWEQGEKRETSALLRFPF